MEKVYLGWIFIAIGCFALLPICYYIFIAIKSRSWPKRMAMITYNSLAVKKAGYWEGRSLLSGDLIKYRYNVERVDYENSQITAADLIVKLMVASDELLANFPEKEMLEIAYNPNKPQQSLLITGLTKWNFLPIVTIGIFIAVGIALVIGRI
ncbi:DUF3592 domain-containing protein [Motilimonas sp. 1_MG-2023]|uniref:DUF3592 domain-containing protein n=1 Tax=Motilimonas TaxID=1914248 RepID=UPI0026E37934|nr:DUF3592 domain-containing protein [Motilimonas sp. 1_MG-2023]MDO6524052.1 DUF3592 domain-containing protein [Motilimonas sp. 1_MG-2023]